MTTFTEEYFCVPVIMFNWVKLFHRAGYIVLKLVQAVIASLMVAQRETFNGTVDALSMLRTTGAVLEQGHVPALTAAAQVEVRSNSLLWEMMIFCRRYFLPGTL